MGKRAPAAPDPYATAQAQGQVNTQAAAQQAGINTDTARLQNRMNRTNTYSPQGSVTQTDMGDAWLNTQMDRHRSRFNNGDAGTEGWGKDGVFDEAGVRDHLSNVNPDRDRWESRVTLSPEQQRLYDQGVELDSRTGQMALDQLPRLQRLLSEDVSQEGLPAWQSSVNTDGLPALQSSVSQEGLPAWALDDVDARNRTTAAITARMEPQFQRDREGMEARLLSQGFVPGSEAYNRAADEMSRARTDARLQTDAAGMAESRAGAAFNNATRGGMLAERYQGAGFSNAARGQGLDEGYRSAEFSNNSRGAQLAERLQLRAQPINEVSALFGLGNGMQMPGQIQMPGTNVANTGLNPVDLAGMIQNNYAGKNANYQAILGMYGQVAGAAAGAATRSDRRLKRDVRHVGQADNGLPIYSYRYLWSDQVHVGFMADEVAEVRPEAVTYDAGGFAWVDYGKAAA